MKTKLFVISKLTNGFLIQIQNAEGKDEQVILQDDDSLAFHSLADAFERSQEATVEKDAGCETDGQSNGDSGTATSAKDLLEDPRIRSAVGGLIDGLVGASHFIGKGRGRGDD